MAICETCGTHYSPTAEALECPKCATSTRRPPSPARPSVGSGTPVPRRSEPASHARPVQRTGPSKPAGPAEPAEPVKVRQDAARGPAVRHERAGAARRAAAAPEAREPRPAAGVLDSSAKIGLVVTAVLAIVVFTAVALIARKKASERRALAAYEKQVSDLHQELLAFNMEDEASARRLVQTAKDKENLWREHRLAGDIQSLVSRATASMEMGRERREALERFAEIERKLESPEKLAPDELKDMRRTLEELEAQIALGGAELVARSSLARAAVDRTYATRLLDEAQAFEEANRSSPRLALVRYQLVEDETKELLDRAHRDRNQELQDFYTPLYQKAIEQSDRLVTAVFTAEESEGLPWIDCLAGEQVGFWNPSSAKGFSHRIENGVLQIIGPDADAGRIAVISIGDREQWRNFVVDLEFAIERGDLEMYFRLGRTPSVNTVSHSLKAEGEDADLIAGRKYQARASLLGSRFVFRYATEDIDTPSPHDEQVSWIKNRKGAIGLVVPAGTRARFTRFRVRELR